VFKNFAGNYEQARQQLTLFEETSNVDSDLDQQVLPRLRTKRTTKSTVVIQQRPSSSSEADDEDFNAVGTPPSKFVNPVQTLATFEPSSIQQLRDNPLVYSQQESNLSTRDSQFAYNGNTMFYFPPFICLLKYKSYVLFYAAEHDVLIGNSGQTGSDLIAEGITPAVLPTSQDVAFEFIPTSEFKEFSSRFKGKTADE